MLNLGEILPHVSTRLARRNLAFDLARGAASIHDADRDRYLPQMRTALALGLRILRAQRREDRTARKSASCLACREDCWFHDATYTLCPRFLSGLGVRSA
jgi:hypothetical protein